MVCVPQQSCNLPCLFLLFYVTVFEDEIKCIWICTQSVLLFYQDELFNLLSSVLEVVYAF